VWATAINDEVRARRLTVLLMGLTGNMTISYDGSELLAELLRAGRGGQWLRTVTAIVRTRQWRLRGALSATFAPWLPAGVWGLLCRLYYGESTDVSRYAAILPSRLQELDLPTRAAAHGLDLAYRPWKDGVAMRLWVLSRVD